MAHVICSITNKEYLATNSKVDDPRWATEVTDAMVFYLEVADALQVATMWCDTLADCVLLTYEPG